MRLCLCADVCVWVLWTCLGSAFAKIYTNCSLNTQGLSRPFPPTQHSTTGRPSNKAFRIVSFPVGPLDNPHNPLHQPHSVPALPSLAMRHGSTDDRLMRRKYFYRIAFRRSTENQWQPLLWASARRLGTFISLSPLVFMGRHAVTDHSSLTYSESCSL